MKTELLKIGVLFTFIILLMGCCDCNYISFSIDERNGRDIKHDICSSKDAIISGKYNTNKGEAEFSIPVPKNHSLKKIKQTKNSVDFITTGEDFTNEFVIYNVKLGGFETGRPQAIITINLEVNYTERNLCPSLRGERKKQSEVTGAPKRN
ncbi:hypothetical protein [Winogradskyella sp.]|uniref:hypothetical protein n=1 Tax=Winogradskyella sp. TaxID=1883156 RepID=UPI0026207541|nr:hypothetical protein [Winogradskyella sp.]